MKEKKEWKRVRLGEVLTPAKRSEIVVATKEYRLLGVRLEGRGPFIRETVLGANTSAKRLYRVEAGDFIYSRLFACRGAFGVIDEDTQGCFVSNEFPIYRPISDRIDVQFLRYWFTLPSVIARVDEDCTGSTPLTRNRFKENFFLALEIPLPPLSEQRRIVARIEALTAEIAEAKRLRQEAVEEAEVVCKNRIDACILHHSSDWSHVTVAEIIQSMDAGWSPQCERVSALQDEWGVLKTTAVQWRKFQPEHSKLLPSALKPRQELAVRKGDVLVTRAGPRKRVAVIATARDSFPRLMISDKLIRLRPIEQKVEPRFLEIALCSSFSQEHLVQRKTGLADAQVNISQEILRATPLVLPPLPEQRRIVAEFDALEDYVANMKRLQAETAAELDVLLPAILDRAFKGEL